MAQIKEALMVKPPEILRTARLLLRLPVVEDAEQIFTRYSQDYDVTKYLIWRPHKSVDETIIFLERCILGWKEMRSFPWVVVRKEDGTLIGMIEMRIVNGQADIGYVLAQDVWGQSYATEMAKAVVSWAMEQPQIQRVWATCDCDNVASARVLEKVGLKFEKVLKEYIVHPNISDDPRDSMLYSISK
jgi:[ribosomal protein S5]-alanine N-acetyltransferase